MLGPEFEANAEAFFGPDRFHPSSMGYRRIGASLVPPVLAALDLAPTRGRRAITAAPSWGEPR
jgi:lysophospholipase L1-like esterase